MGLATAGAMFALGRWSTSRVREWSALHTIGRGGADGAAGGGGTPGRPNGGPPGTFAGPLAEGVTLGAPNVAGAQSSAARAADVRTFTGAKASEGGAATPQLRHTLTTPPNTSTAMGEAEQR
jgi:hypothetical protein